MGRWFLASELKQLRIRRLKAGVAHLRSEAARD